MGIDQARRASNTAERPGSVGHIPSATVRALAVLSHPIGQTVKSLRMIVDLTMVMGGTLQMGGQSLKKRHEQTTINTTFSESTYRKKNLTLHVKDDEAVSRRSTAAHPRMPETLPRSAPRSDCGEAERGTTGRPRSLQGSLKRSVPPKHGHPGPKRI